MADSMRLAIMDVINVTPLMEKRLDRGLHGCEALGPHGHGVMCSALLFFRQGRGSDRRLRLVPSASWCPCDCHRPLLPPPSSHSDREWHKCVAVSLSSHGTFYPMSFLAFSSCFLSLVAGNAHPLVCPNREVSLPEQTSP